MAEKSKIKLFISYCSKDDNKKRTLHQAFKKAGFDSIVVAQRDAPGKPLSDKVKEGIDEADYLIPIITSRSYRTQWMNQEIGYATGSGKDIRALIQGSTLNQLKGFIHNQIDQPFTFKVSTNKRKEAANFRVAYTKLINYLKQPPEPDDGIQVPIEGSPNAPASPIYQKTYFFTKKDKTKGDNLLRLPKKTKERLHVDGCTLAWEKDGDKLIAVIKGQTRKGQTKSFASCVSGPYDILPSKGTFRASFLMEVTPISDTAFNEDYWVFDLDVASKDLEIPNSITRHMSRQFFVKDLLQYFGKYHEYTIDFSNRDIPLNRVFEFRVQIISPIILKVKHVTLVEVDE